MHDAPEIGQVGKAEIVNVWSKKLAVNYKARTVFTGEFSSREAEKLGEFVPQNVSSFKLRDILSNNFLYG